MEVSGKVPKTEKTYSLSKGSAEDFLLFCIPCDRDGERKSAEGYCKTCNEHLCKACYKHHKKPAPTRHHILMDQDSMPTTQSKYQEDFDICNDHGDEKLNFYCRDDNTVACSICVTLNHRLCTVEYIPNLSKQALEGTELKNLMAEMKALEELCKSRIQIASDKIKATTQNHEEIIKVIHQFRKEINTQLDQMENLVVKEAECLFKKQQMELRKLSKNLEDIKEEMTNKQACLDTMIQRNCIDKLFIEIRDAKNQLEKMKRAEKQQSEETKIQIIKFLKNDALADILEKQKHLGELEAMKGPVPDNVAKSDTSTPNHLEDKTLYLEVVDDMDMKDRKECDITGIAVIQSNKIVVCDSKVKYYDTVQKRVISETQLEDNPFDVTATTDDKVAVTVPNEKSIYFMSLTNGRLSSDSKVNINEECRGIAYSRDKLVVSSCDFGNLGCILVLDLHGKVLYRYGGNRRAFHWPEYIAVNTAGTAIYVSDWGRNVKAVKQMDWQGNVVNTYTPAQGGDFLQGICELNDGTFLVCMEKDSEDNLQRLSTNCKLRKMIMNNTHRGWYPKAVAYCKDTRKLYVSYSERGYKSCIKVFKVDWL